MIFKTTPQVEQEFKRLKGSEFSGMVNLFRSTLAELDTKARKLQDEVMLRQAQGKAQVIADILELIDK